MVTENNLSFSCHNITCHRGEIPIFSQLGFIANAGDLVVLTGVNGAGKSSLLRILAGLLPSQEGEILWREESIHAAAAYKDESLFIGHQNALKLTLSVYENLLYYARLKRTSMLVLAALHFFGLLPLAEMPAGQLSAGWQRRVALARLVSEPSLLWLLDEPFSNLDAQGKELLEGLIDTRLKQGGIVILSSHEKLANPSARYLAIEEFAAHV